MKPRRVVLTIELTTSHPIARLRSVIQTVFAALSVSLGELHQVQANVIRGKR